MGQIWRLAQLMAESSSGVSTLSTSFKSHSTWADTITPSTQLSSTPWGFTWRVRRVIRLGAFGTSSKRRSFLSRRVTQAQSTRWISKKMAVFCALATSMGWASYGTCGVARRFSSSQPTSAKSFPSNSCQMAIKSRLEATTTLSKSGT